MTPTPTRQVVDWDELRRAEDIVRKYDQHLADEVYALGCFLADAIRRCDELAKQ